MKSIYRFLFISLVSLSIIYAESGLQQKHLLGISPNHTEVTAKSNFLFTFDMPILPSSVKKYTIMLKQKKPHKEKIPTQFTISNNKLTVLPNVLLNKGLYVLKIKPLKLTKKGENALQIKTPWQKFIAWLCGLFYKDISKCPLCHYFCHTSHTIKTKPISFRFEVKEAMPQVIKIDSNTSLLELSEHNSTQIQITATYDDNSTEDVTQKATYRSDDSSVDVEKGIITTNAEGSAKVTVSYEGKTINIQVEVYEMIEGHLLPHAPDYPDATLLGVDENNNSVRDDVERWIYKEMPTYHHPEIERVVAYQYASAFQESLKNPNNEGEKTLKIMDKAGYCWGYYIHSRQIPFSMIEKYKANLKDKQFNTKERLKTYFMYNQNLGASVVTIRDSKSDDCDINIDQLP